MHLAKFSFILINLIYFFNVLIFGLSLEFCLQTFLILCASETDELEPKAVFTGGQVNYTIHL